MSATKVAIIGLFAALLVASMVAADNVTVDKPITSNASEKAIQELCAKTNNQTTCIDSLSKATNSSDTKTLIQVSFQLILKEVDNVLKLVDELKKNSTDDGVIASYQCCQNWLPRSIDYLQRAVDAVSKVDTTADFAALSGDIQDYVTSTLTYQETCVDCFDEDWEGATKMREIQKVLRDLTLNGITLANQFPNLVKTASNS